MMLEIEAISSTSEQTTELYKALIKFQMRALVVRKEANNTHFRSQYATLGDVLSVIQKPLAEDGLAVIQVPCRGNYLVTRVVHESGEWMQCVSELNPVEVLVSRGDKDNPDRYAVTPQAIGSATTYARRYALTAILNIRVDDCEDDDGNAASNVGGENGRARSTSREASRPPVQRSSAPAGTTKPEAVPAPRTEEERIALMRSLITKDPIKNDSDFTRFESAIARNVSSGGLSKENASGVIRLLACHAALSIPIDELVVKIGPRVLEMKNRGLINEEDYLGVTAAFEEAAKKNG